MLSSTENNTIVSLQSNQYFNSIIFMAKKLDLIKLVDFPWKRVTDLFRLFPKVELIKLTFEQSKFFIGINTMFEYKIAIELSKKLTNMYFNTKEYKRLKILRNINLQQNKLFSEPQNFINELFREKGYFLLINLCFRHHLYLPLSKKEILELESELWKEINTVI